MKKIININLHGRVVPIEETAYEMLQQYIESLRVYFANEEGRDEIINDIENRFAELFSESLKKGASCITDPDVNIIITSMGRPEDFEQEERANASGTQPTGSSNSSSAGGSRTSSSTPGAGSNTGAGSQDSSSQKQSSSSQTAHEPRTLYRSENDKILGGVCAGMANYFRLDPAFVRIFFVLITFGWGAGVLLYFVLWAVLPTRSLPVNARKRLFRNTDDRVLGGVASGLAAYFHVEVWIPRVIFALPLILSIITSIFRDTWFRFGRSEFFTGGFGGTLFISYIVLWIVLPEASSASEKLEMRGEKVDLESIKNTIKSDLEGFKGRAKDMGDEMKERFQQVSEDMQQGARGFASEAAPVARTVGHGIGHAIGMVFKIFFLIIAGMITFAMIMILVGLFFGGASLLNFKSYIVEGFWPNALIGGTFFLFLVVPVLALLTWLIRRITGARSRGHYLRYIFAVLWIIGLGCFIGLAGMVLNSFRDRQHVAEEVPLIRPSHGKLVIKANGNEKNFYEYDDDQYDYKWDKHNFFNEFSKDSLILKTVRVILIKSPDSDYHVQLIKLSRGNDPHVARELASQIEFPVRQADSMLYLPNGFAVTRFQKFRNQQVVVSVAIPVGKRISLDWNIDNYDWFTVNVNRHHLNWTLGGDHHGEWNDEDDEENYWNNGFSWSANTEYIMTSSGLVQSDNMEHPEKKERKEQPERQEQQERPEQPEKQEMQPAPPSGTDGGGYRYHQKHDSSNTKGGKVTSTEPSGTIRNNDDQSICLLAALLNPY